MDVLMKPTTKKTPFVLHVILFPAPHNACGTYAGDKNGPDSIVNDSKSAIICVAFMDTISIGMKQEKPVETRLLGKLRWQKTSIH
jgi:hypothetical protein